MGSKGAREARALALALIFLAQAGCGGAPQPGVPLPAVAQPQVAVPQRWFGRWNGPEGTWLEIAAAGAGYRVTIANLDGPRTFDANAVEGGLTFHRDGRPEVITATDGAGTGMKWLTEKSDCLRIRPGEGFCRD